MDDLLLIQYFEGGATDEETQLVNNWLEADNKNMTYYLQLCRIQEISIWHESRDTNHKTSYGKPKQKALWLEVLKIAAVFALGFLLNQGFILLSEEEAAEMQTMHVPAGQTAQLLLADGSKVWLSAGSSLNFPTHFSKAKRQVLLEGEGFFEVKSDPKNPFIVSTANFDVKALGTSFNVIAYQESDEFETALLNGRVEISNHSNQLVAELLPNEQAVLNNNQLTKTEIKNMDYFLWREGILSFDNPLAEVLNKLEIYFDITIQIKNKSILENKKQCTGKFRTRDGINHILDVLQTITYFSYEKHEDKNLIIIN